VPAALVRDEERRGSPAFLARGNKLLLPVLLLLLMGVVEKRMVVGVGGM
jgi:hypothetical protein